LISIASLCLSLPLLCLSFRLSFFPSSLARARARSNVRPGKERRIHSSTDIPRQAVMRGVCTRTNTRTKVSVCTVYLSSFQVKAPTVEKTENTVFGRVGYELSHQDPTFFIPTIQPTNQPNQKPNQTITS
jgi:hypothetical protein